MNEKMRSALKEFYYSKIGKKIRKYPQLLYFKTKCLKHKNMMEKQDHENRRTLIKIVFLLEYPEVWNSSKSVFEAFQNDERAKVFLIALPKFPNDLSRNEAYEFALPLYDNVINGYEDGKWFDLKALHPDYIFYTRPYDKEYPANFKPKNTARYAKNCYISYGYDFTIGYHNEVSYNLKTFPYMYMVFCEGNTAANYCKKMCGNFLKYSKKIYTMGFPRFDLLYEMCSFTLQHKNNDNNYLKTVLWTPRWSLDDKANNGTSYFQLIDDLVHFFNEEKNLSYKLIIRPHPLMFENFVSKGRMSHAKVEALMREGALGKNIEFDKNIDYLKTLENVDIVISDYSSLLIEYLVLGIPTIYCDKADTFDEDGIIMDTSMYHANGADETISILEKLLNGEDTLKIKRLEAREKISAGFDGKIGKRISLEVINDYKGEC